MLSAISTSVIMTLFLTLGTAVLGSGTRFAADLRRPVTSKFPSEFDLMIGFATYLGYHVIGGYQHMNFTFRYWVPGLVGAMVVAAQIIAKRAVRSEPNRDTMRLDSVIARLFAAPAVGVLLLQVAQTGLAGFQAKNIDVALTVSPLKDRFSIDSYAQFLKSWLQAGLDLDAVVKPEHRLFLVQGMATGAFTGGYRVDQFYFRPNRSRFDDLRTCVPQPHNQSNCAILYDYYVTFPDKNYWPASHEAWNLYSTISVLKRKSLPVPGIPTDLRATRISGDTIDVSWTPALGNFHSDIEVQQATGSNIVEVPPDYRIFRVSGVSGENIRVRIRACNDKGCSDWSGPVAVD
jgi:hypothetical protein